MYIAALSGCLSVDNNIELRIKNLTTCVKIPIMHHEYTNNDCCSRAIVSSERTISNKLF